MLPPQSPHAPAEALFTPQALPPLLRLLRCADASVRFLALLLLTKDAEAAVVLTAPFSSIRSGC